MLPVTSHFLYPTIIIYPTPRHTSNHKGSGSHRVKNVDPQIHLMAMTMKGRFQGLNSWHPPELNGKQMPGLSGSRLQARGGRSMQPWVLVSCISWLRNPEHWNVHISQEFHFWNWCACKVLQRHLWRTFAIVGVGVSLPVLVAPSALALSHTSTTPWRNYLPKPPHRPSKNVSASVLDIRMYVIHIGHSYVYSLSYFYIASTLLVW